MSTFAPLILLALLTRVLLITYAVTAARSKFTVSTAVRGVLDVLIGLTIIAAVAMVVPNGADLFWEALIASSMASIAVFAVGERSTLAAALLISATTHIAISVGLAASFSAGVFSAGSAMLPICAAGVAGALAIGPRVGKFRRDGSTAAITGHAPALSLAAGSALSLLLFGFALRDVVPLSTTVSTFEPVMVTLMYGLGCVAPLAVQFGRSRRLDIGHVVPVLIAVGLTTISFAGSQFEVTWAQRWVLLASAVATGFASIVIQNVFEFRLKIDDVSNLLAALAAHSLVATVARIAMNALRPPGPGPGLQNDLLGIAVSGGAAIAAALLVIVTLWSMRLLSRARLTDAQEFEGADLAEHDANGYPDFQQTTIKSYHLREL